MYTGQNREVLNLDLKYEFAYFDKGRYYDGQQNKLKNDDDKLEPKKSVGTNVPNKGMNIHGPRTSKAATPVTPTAPNVSDTINPDAPAENREMADLFRDRLENPRADLVVINLSILGDPFWIEQKSIKPGNKQMTSNGQTEPDGSVSPDANNIVVQINAKYPSDLDDETGLMRLDRSAFFQGKFRVFECESNFESGIFSQELTMSRFEEQANDVQMLGLKDIAGDFGGGYTSADDVRESFRGTATTSNVIKKTKSVYKGIGRKSSPVAQKSVPRLNFTGR
jgi:hypothetical protein